MSEQKPEPLSADELSRAAHEHCDECLGLELAGCDCGCHWWTRRLLATIDARDADLATARRTMDEMQAGLDLVCFHLQQYKAERDSLAEQLKAREAEVARLRQQNHDFASRTQVGINAIKARLLPDQLEQDHRARVRAFLELHPDERGKAERSADLLGYSINDGTAVFMAFRMCDEAKAEIARKDAALRPFAAFAEAFDKRPIQGLDDAMYGIHGGESLPGGAVLRLSDCRAAEAALKPAPETEGERE